MRAVARLAVLLQALVWVVDADEWSFKAFLEGEWDLERRTEGALPRTTPLHRLRSPAAHPTHPPPRSTGAIDHAHYSFKAVGAALEGSYFEDADDGSRTNEMFVRVLFDDATSGQFQLGKLPEPEEPAAGDAPEPVPQPSSGAPERDTPPKTKTVFEFDFRAQSDERVWLSETVWNGNKGGAVQFLALEDSFVFTKVAKCSKNTCDADAMSVPSVSTWTAVRKGSPRYRVAPEPKRSLLQRYGWYLFAGIAYFLYQGAKEKAAGLAGQMKKNM
jgi:hypothetical protein